MNEMVELAERVEKYDPALSADNRADELALHQDIVMLTGEGSLACDFDRTFVRSLDAAMTLASAAELVRFGGPSGLLHEAWSRLSQRFDLHINHWRDGESYAQWLARFVTAAALRARAAQTPERSDQ